MTIKDKIIQEYSDSSDFYVAVLDKLDIPEDDLLLKKLIITSFENNLAKFIALSTIEVSEKKELDALFDYKNSALVVSPALSDEEITMEFLMQYPNVRKKVFETIPEFVNDFINDYKNVKEFITK